MRAPQQKVALASEQETRILAFELAPLILQAGAKSGIEVALCGALGAGKTTFVRYLAEAWGVREPVSSPSFVLEHEYCCKTGEQIEHWDLYRLSALPDELKEPPEQGVVRVVEWGDRSEEFLKRAGLKLFFSFGKPGSPAEAREAQLEGFGKLKDIYGFGN